MYGSGEVITITGTTQVEFTIERKDKIGVVDVHFTAEKCPLQVPAGHYIPVVITLPAKPLQSHVTVNTGFIGRGTMPRDAPIAVNPAKLFRLIDHPAQVEVVTCQIGGIGRQIRVSGQF